MFFTVLPVRGRPPEGAVSRAFLVDDRWDDFSYKTVYSLLWCDQSGSIRDIGVVRIGQFDMGERRSPDIPEEFDALDDRFFSLAGDAGYYERLTELDD
jgi:hypothetical protein